MLEISGLTMCVMRRRGTDLQVFELSLLAYNYFENAFGKPITRAEIFYQLQCPEAEP